MNKFLFLIILGLGACTASTEMKDVPYDYLINDGNSKVWMIDQMIVGKTDISSQQNEEKELIIFYNSGRFQYIPIKQLGHSKGKTGTYVLSSIDRELKMYFQEKIWHFKFDEISEDSIYLTPIKGANADFSIQLVPLKEILF